uniref:Uncharacterized protein n=1 Tax=Arundo donax TaxID=35708 RepID=A0A0A8ZZL2_ARUDO
MTPSKRILALPVKKNIIGTLTVQM